VIADAEIPRIIHSKVMSIKKIGKSNVLNISVKNNKSFFLANGILTHNTSDAQTALRRIMEESSRTTRFILTANYSSNIIEPIQSRCAVFRFSRLTETDVVSYMELICKKEGVKFTRQALATIFEATEGDMRHALNMLQAASTLGDISNENVNKVTGISGKAKVAEVIDIALEGDFSSARIKMIELLQVNGMSEHDFIKFSNEAISRSKYSNSLDALQATAEADYRLLLGANPDIQLSAYLAQLAKIGKQLKK
jgi:replication factor C small subunit